MLIVHLFSLFWGLSAQTFAKLSMGLFTLFCLPVGVLYILAIQSVVSLWTSSTSFTCRISGPTQTCSIRIWIFKRSPSDSGHIRVWETLFTHSAIILHLWCASSSFSSSLQLSFHLWALSSRARIFKKLLCCDIYQGFILWLVCPLSFKKFSSPWGRRDSTLYFLLKALVVLFTDCSSPWTFYLSVAFHNALISFFHVANNYPSAMPWINPAIPGRLVTLPWS